MTIAAAIALGALIAACSGGGSEVTLDGSPDPESGFVAAEGERNQLEESISSVPEALGNVDPAPAETSTSTTTTTTTEAPGPVDPEEAGATAARTEGLGVITSPGDPLNVRLGPGTNYGIIAELEHRTVGITSTHVIDVGTVEWRYVEVDGEPAGWVAGRFLQRTVATAFCSAPSEMPAGLTGHSPIRVDIDNDRILDEVAVFKESLGGNQSQLWIRSDTSTGGVVAGRTGTLVNAPNDPELFVKFLTNSSRDGFGSQFIVEVSRSGSSSSYQVFDQQRCALEVTTLNGQPFSFELGNSGPSVFESGCIYGGENRFVTLVDNGSTRTISEYALRETEWTFPTQTLTGVDADSGEFPVPAGFTTCLEG